MFNPSFRKGFAVTPRVSSNPYEEKMSAPNNAYYVLTQAHAGLPNSVLFNTLDTDDLSEGVINLYYTDVRVGTYSDAAYLKLDGSNANQDINIGAYDFTTTGDISCDNLTATTKVFALTVEASGDIKAFNDVIGQDVTASSTVTGNTFVKSGLVNSGYVKNSAGTLIFGQSITCTSPISYTGGSVTFDYGYEGTWVTTQNFRNIYPSTDDTYYLGKNSAATPKAWKGVILKDTADGNVYRIEVTNGVVTATRL